MTNKDYIFRGGVWIGFIASTWPSGVLEVSQNQLAVIDECLKRERRYSHDEIEKIEIKKYLPIIGYGIKIIPHDKTNESFLYFWYVSFYFENLINTLKKFGWIN
jgi:hypothetical protein